MCMTCVSPVVVVADGSASAAGVSTALDALAIALLRGLPFLRTCICFAVTRTRFPVIRIPPVVAWALWQQHGVWSCVVLDVSCTLLVVEQHGSGPCVMFHGM